MGIRIVRILKVLFATAAGLLAFIAGAFVIVAVAVGAALAFLLFRARWRLGRRARANVPPPSPAAKGDVIDVTATEVPSARIEP